MHDHAMARMDLRLLSLRGRDGAASGGAGGSGGWWCWSQRDAAAAGRDAGSRGADSLTKHMHDNYN